MLGLADAVMLVEVVLVSLGERELVEVSVGKAVREVSLALGLADAVMLGVMVLVSLGERELVGVLVGEALNLTDAVMFGVRVLFSLGEREGVGVSVPEGDADADVWVGSWLNIKKQQHSMTRDPLGKLGLRVFRVHGISSSRCFCPGTVCPLDISSEELKKISPPVPAITNSPRSVMLGLSSRACVSRSHGLLAVDESSLSFPRLVGRASMG